MPQVLFVCVHNAGRSQMAEAIFNQEAKRRRIDARAESAGTLATDRINPLAVQALEEIGIETDRLTPKQLSQEMVDAAARVVTMGCGVDAGACPARFLVTEDWGLDDPAGQPIETVRMIRDLIRAKVDKMLEELT